MLVKDIMSKRPRAIMPETSIAEAMSLMRFYQIDGLPVVINRKLIGFVQLRELLTIFITDNTPRQKRESGFDMKRLQNKYTPIARAAVKQFMRTDRKTAAPDMSVHEAMEVMLHEHMSRLAVTDGDMLAGMISLDDVNKAILGITSTKVAA